MALRLAGKLPCRGDSTTVLIIPVLDIQSGQVVGARAGRRECYRPLESRLAASPHPAAVVQGLLGLYPFTTLYVADLDAIAKRGDNLAVLQRLATRFPSLSFWVDAGFTQEIELARWRGAGRIRPVIGSESHDDAAHLARLLALATPEPPVLSLDFHNGELRGPGEILANLSTSPTDVILMEIDRIGTERGPNSMRLERMREQLPLTAFYVAGGIRGIHDLQAIAAHGAAGALIASALHQNRITRQDLCAIAR